MIIAFITTTIVAYLFLTYIDSSSFSHDDSALYKLNLSEAIGIGFAAMFSIYASMNMRPRKYPKNK